MLKDIIRKDLVSCEPNATVHEVARLMKEKDVGAVLVIEKNGSPKGIITDRDLVIRCLSNKTDCEKVRIEEVMTKVVQTVSENDGIYNLAQKMKSAKVRRIPVVNNAGKAVALLSLNDVFQLLAEEMNNLKIAIQPTQTKIERQAA